jgi:hypothetical protein
MRFNQTHNMRTSSPMPEPTRGSQRPFDFLALQLQTIAPKPLSQVGSDLQLLEAFIWLQSLVPIQAHRRSPP